MTDTQETPITTGQSVVDDLLADYISTDETKTFNVPKKDGSKGVDFTFRLVNDSSEIVAIEKRAQAFIKACKSRSVPPQMLEFLPAAEEVLRQVVFVSELLITPKMTQLDCMRLAKKGSGLFLQIASVVDSAVAVSSSQAEIEAIEEEKNG